MSFRQPLFFWSKKKEVMEKKGKNEKSIGRSSRVRSWEKSKK